MFGIILWSAMWLTLACIYFPRRNEVKFKKNIALGVTLPQEAHSDPDVLLLLGDFKRKNDLVCGLLALLSIAGAFLRDLALSLTGWALVLVVILTVPPLLFARYNRKLKGLKQAKGWRSPGAQVLRVDTAGMIDYPKPKPLPYLLPALLCLLPALCASRLRWVYLLFLAVVLLSYVCALFLYRRRSEAVDDSAQLTRALSSLRYRMWKGIWVVSAYCSAASALSTWVLERSPAAGIALLLLSSLAFTGILLATEMHTRRLQEQLTAESGGQWYADEDDFWLGGLIYCNPNDKHTIVNARVGVGTSVNLATRAGKLLCGFCAVVLAGTLALLVSSGFADRSPISLEVDGRSLLCESAGVRYQIPLDEICSAAMVDRMPEGLWRTNGLGGQHLLLGSFTGGGMLDLKIMADPTAPPYLRLETVSETFYILGARDPADTRAIYESLSR